MTSDRARNTTALPPLSIAPTDGHLESLVVEDLGPSSEPKSGNRFAIVVAELFNKLIMAVPNDRTAPAHVAENVSGHV